jgi:predicted nucleic acid-binding Zn finger protein
MDIPKNKDIDSYQKISKIISSGGVKRHTFLPSGTEIWTVVGNDGEYIQYPEREICTCPQFFFKKMHGDLGPCYHVLSVKSAKLNQSYVTIGCNDDELHILIQLLLQ